MTKENKKLMNTVIGIAIMILLIFVVDSYNKNNARGKLITTDLSLYESVISEGELNIVYIARPTCSYCKKFSPILDEVIKEYNLEVYYLNTDELEDSDFSTITATFPNYFDENGFSTPSLLIVKNNELVSSQVGYTDKSKLVSFLENNNIIGSNKSNSSNTYSEDVLVLNKIDVDAYVKKLNSDKVSAIYVGTETCSVCLTFSPTLKKVVSNYNLDIDYIDVGTLTNEEKSKLVNNNSYYKDEREGAIVTPIVFIVKNGEIVDKSSGAVSESSLIEFLTKNEIIK